MSTEVTKPSVVGSKETATEETQPKPPIRRVGEGMGVFRALLLMILSYTGFAILAWFAWHAFRQWHHH